MPLPHDRYALEGRHPVADGGRRNSSSPIPPAREVLKEVHLLLALTNSQSGTESCCCSSLLPHYRRYPSAGCAFLSEPFTHHTPDGSDAGCKARPRGPPNPRGYSSQMFCAYSWCQNSSLRLSCPIRGAAADCANPKFAALMFPCIF